MLHIFFDCDERSKPPHRSTLDWLASLSDGDHAKLVGIGGTEAREVEAVLTLKMLYDSFLESKASMKKSTKATYGQAWTVLSLRFGESRAIETITKAEARSFREWLAIEGNQREGRTPSGTRRPRTAKEFGRETPVAAALGSAAKSSSTELNQSGSVKIRSRALPLLSMQILSGFHYVPMETFSRTVDFAPDATMRAIIALNRLIGFRIPSEIKSLKWSDVDLSKDNGHLKIKAPKTEHHRKRGLRTAPILPTLRPYLEDLATLAQPGIETPLSAAVFPRFVNASDSAIRSAVEKILSRAGIEQWPKPVLATDESRRSLIYWLRSMTWADVAAWVGNSPAVIWEYYAMATENESPPGCCFTERVGPRRKTVDQFVDQIRNVARSIQSYQPRKTREKRVLLTLPDCRKNRMSGR